MSDWLYILAFFAILICVYYYIVYRDSTFSRFLNDIGLGKYIISCIILFFSWFLIALLINKVLKASSVVSSCASLILVIISFAIIVLYKYKKVYKSYVREDNNKTKETRPYPMNPTSNNTAIGAVDKCCEFASYVEKYVIPAGICSPETFSCYVIASPNGISFGFAWKTFCYSLDSYIEKKGYSIRGEGFDFSENSGMVIFQRTITNDSAEYASAYSYMISTSTEAIIAEFEKVAENNFSSLGLYNHNASCRCVLSEADRKDFEITV